METTWIFIIIGLLILFFLFTNTIYITTSTSTVEEPKNICGVSKYGCCPDKITSRTDALGNNCSKKTNTSSVPAVTSPPATTIQPSPYVAQNVANTTPYPPATMNLSTMLVPIPIPPPGSAAPTPTPTPTPTPLADQQQLPPKVTTTNTNTNTKN